MSICWKICEIMIFLYEVVFKINFVGKDKFWFFGNFIVGVWFCKELVRFIFVKDLLRFGGGFYVVDSEKEKVMFGLGNGDIMLVLEFIFWF